MTNRKLENLRKIQDIIEELLKSEPRTRSDDFYLYARLAEIIAKQNGNADNTELKHFIYVLKYHSQYNIPSFSTSFRTRQKLQSENPEYKNAYIAAKREENERVFRKFIKD